MNTLALRDRFESLRDRVDAVRPRMEGGQLVTAEGRPIKPLDVAAMAGVGMVWVAEEIVTGRGPGRKEPIATIGWGLGASMGIKAIYDLGVTEIVDRVRSGEPVLEGVNLFEHPSATVRQD